MVGHGAPRRSSDAVRSSVRSYGVKVMDPAMLPLQPRPGVTSHGSLARLSERSLHSEYPREKGCCAKCMMRVPYGTLVATILCIGAVGIFVSTVQRAITLTVVMLDQVFQYQSAGWHIGYTWFTILGGIMIGTALLILFIGVLATGATRQKVYRKWQARVGGRISCVVFMSFSYFLMALWIVILCFLICMTLLVYVARYLCTSDRVKNQHQCIDLTQFDFFFSSSALSQRTTPLNLMLCEPHQIKLFCKDFVEKGELMYFLSVFASIAVLISLVHYLMCLSANYAHIRDHSKLQELQELQYLSAESDGGLHSSKDRF